MCARSNIWSHATCLKLSKTSLNYYLQHPEIDWTCSLCCLADFNDPFFNHDEHDSEVDTNLTADLSTAEKVQADIRQLRVNSKKRCIIANLNINSIPNQFVEIQDWLKSNATDILLLQETKTDRSFPNTQFHVDGYNLFRRDRTKGGGGIAVCIRTLSGHYPSCSLCKSAREISLSSAHTNIHLFLFCFIFFLIKQ